MKVVTYWISQETSPLGYCSSNQLRCQERICISLLKIAHSITASADTGHATDRCIGYVREYVHMYIRNVCTIYKAQTNFKTYNIEPVTREPPHHALLPTTKGQIPSWLEMQYNTTYQDVCYSERQLSGSVRNMQSFIPRINLRNQ